MAAAASTGVEGHGEQAERRRQSRLLELFHIPDTTDNIIYFAASYAIVKMLFPMRIAMCVGLTPWFARWAIEPAKRIMTGWRSKWK